jgi:hypothetical protein
MYAWQANIRTARTAGRAGVGVNPLRDTSAI